MTTSLALNPSNLEDIFIPEEIETSSSIRNFYSSTSSTLEEEFVSTNENEFIIKTELIKKTLSWLKEIKDLDISFFEEECIEKPNSTVFDNTSIAIGKLGQKFIFPQKISISSESGTFLVFKNTNNQKLYFEFYNDGEFGYLIEDCNTKKLLANADLYSLDEVLETIEKFINYPL